MRLPLRYPFIVKVIVNCGESKRCLGGAYIDFHVCLLGPFGPRNPMKVG
jgi:hypothetical protein